jgi:hypothetical protein
MGFFNVGQGRGYLWGGLAEALKNQTDVQNKLNELQKRYDLMYNTQSGLIGQRAANAKELEELKFNYKSQLAALSKDAATLNTFDKLTDKYLDSLKLQHTVENDTKLLDYDKKDVLQGISAAQDIIRNKIKEITATNNQNASNNPASQNKKTNIPTSTSKSPIVKTQSVSNINSGDGGSF